MFPSRRSDCHRTREPVEVASGTQLHLLLLGELYIAAARAEDYGLEVVHPAYAQPALNNRVRQAVRSAIGHQHVGGQMTTGGPGVAVDGIDRAEVGAVPSPRPYLAIGPSTAGR